MIRKEIPGMVFTKSRWKFLILIVVLILILIPVVRMLVPSLFIFPWFYRCHPSDPKPDPYLVKACEFVRRHGIRSAAGNPINRTIREIVEGTDPDGSQVIFVFLDCCGDMGDMIRIDKETGVVIGYVKGLPVY
jgi:hypothetical protein